MKDTATYQNSSSSKDPGFFKQLTAQLRLVARLMGDSRVSSFAKLLPIGSIIYLISPVDFIPGAVMPIIGAADDIAVMLFGLKFFVELCPPHVVAEHRAQLGSGNGDSDHRVDEVIDAEIIE